MIFPHSCAFCRQVCNPVPGFPGICRRCLANLPLRTGKGAGLLLLDPRLAFNMPKTNIFCPAYYQGDLRQALLRFKFGDAPELDAALSGLLIQHIRQIDFHPAAIVAVPLHSARLRERGYNQAALLARQIAQQLELPDWSAYLGRNRATSRQSEQSCREARISNLLHAFSLTPKNPIDEIDHSSHRPDNIVLLIDDVLTTGATIIEAARPFWAAGQAVAGMVVASNHH